jgi:ribosomal protein S18 acetylase RimI-like enzyme
MSGGGDRTDIISAALLGVATLASAWCAYQSGLWGGEQTRNLAKTSALHIEALRQASEAETLQLVDVNTFLSYVEKDATGQRKVAANEANGYGDLFVLHTVMFSMALFFLGTSSAARRRGFQRMMLLLGALLLVLSTISMARLPRAPSAPRRSDLQKARANP